MRAVWVVAHPDDETIFFGGLVRRLVQAGVTAEVVCVTSTFANPTLTSVRRDEFRRACWALGARARLLPLVDSAEDLDEEQLNMALAGVRLARADLVFTHGVWGEYGHPHHIQVSRAVHRLVPQVWSLAGPFPDARRHRLGPLALHRKRTLAASAYPSQPFAVAWCTSEERLTRWSKDAALQLCALALGENPPPSTSAVRRPSDGRYPDVAGVPEALWAAGHAERGRRLRAAQLTTAPAPR